MVYADTSVLLALFLNRKRQISTVPPNCATAGRDALHLAIAERHGLTVCTLDKVMKESALALGLPTESI